ncbi:MAG TPA: hypothetical protein PLI95_08580 [Polyangiaceae bacterium]|nr:hypothetical protein [Polyangiaceae bacterium]
MAQGERDATLASAALVASPESKDAKSEEGKGEEGKALEEKGEEGEPKVRGGGTAKEAPAAERAGDGEYAQEPGKTYHSLGARFRMAVVPQFMFGLFGANGGKTVLSPQVGPELAVRRNGFEYDLWLTYASYGMSDAPFKAKDDPNESYEIIRSEIKTVSIGADFLWSARMHRKLSFVYGGGAGIGVVFGDLYRTQSYPGSGVNPDAEGYLPCKGVGNPNGTYCGNDNDHYPGYKEASWIGGGQKPILFPWIAPIQLGLRWTPSPKIVLRLDAGVAFPGPFFFGIAAQHGLF